MIGIIVGIFKGIMVCFENGPIEFELYTERNPNLPERKKNMAYWLGIELET